MKNGNKPNKALLKQIEEQGDELAYLQRKCKEHGIPILILVEGLSAAGKGTLSIELSNRLTLVDSKFPALPRPAGTNNFALFSGAFGAVRQALVELPSLIGVGIETCSMPILIST